jgi:Translation initiation factor IF-2, N-terminal region.
VSRIIEIEDMITVGTLADKLGIPVTRLITELFKNGVMATVNERIDFDTAQIIVDELGLDVQLTKSRNRCPCQYAKTRRWGRRRAASAGSGRYGPCRPRQNYPSGCYQGLSGCKR